MEYLIYEGPKFTIEWYYDERLKSQALAYYETLSVDERDDFLVLVKVLAEKGQIFNKEKFRNEGDKIFAFKPKPNRFLCFFTKGKKVIVTNGFQKKQNKLPANEKEKAKKIRKDYLSRVKDGIYYAKENNL